MQLRIFPDDQAAARAGAALIAAAAREAVSERGKFLVALSGGSSPLKMFDALTAEDVPWEGMHLFQVDERVAPAGDPNRNWTQIAGTLLRRVPLQAEQLHPMPVGAPDLDAAAIDYARQIEKLASTPPAFDFIHLGMGSDGHTASLVPGDGALSVDDAAVTTTGIYQGRRRMTLTYPALNGARQILWLIAGESKQQMLQRLLDGDRDIPAGQVNQDRAIVVADEPAARSLGSPAPR